MINRDGADALAYVEILSTGSGLSDILISMNSSAPHVSMSDTECAFWGAKKEVHTTWTTRARTTDQWFFLRRICIYTNNVIRKIYNGTDVFDIGTAVATRSFVDKENLAGNRRIHCFGMEYCLGNGGDVCTTGDDGLPIMHGGFQCSAGVLFVSICIFILKLHIQCNFLFLGWHSDGPDS